MLLLQPSVLCPTNKDKSCDRSEPQSYPVVERARAACRGPGLFANNFRGSLSQLMTNVLILTPLPGVRIATMISCEMKGAEPQA